MEGWQHTEYVLLLIAVCLLPASAFFSGSETALFGLTESQRMSLRRHRPLVAAAVDALLAEPRLLLITILLGNMLVNVTYFVISSVLMMAAAGGVLAEAGLGVASLLLIVLCGEVFPKTIANTYRTGFSAVTAPGLLLVHRFTGPVRLILDRAVISPLSRLTAPADTPGGLSTDDLEQLLSLSTSQGVIDSEERLTLREVIQLTQMKVRDVMTPRVSIDALPVDATAEQVIDLARSCHRNRIPVYEGNLDHIVGILHVKSYLLRDSQRRPALREVVRPARYVPESATLDQLLHLFHETGEPALIAVDEFGGTAGLVAFDDVVEEIVGDLAAPGDEPLPMTMLVGADSWRVRGDMPVHDWAEAFEHPLPEPRPYSTVGGFVIDRLGRAPQIGDEIDLDRLHIRIDALDGTRVVSVTVTRRPPDHNHDHDHGHGHGRGGEPGDDTPPHDTPPDDDTTADGAAPRGKGGGP